MTECELAAFIAERVVGDPEFTQSLRSARSVHAVIDGLVSLRKAAGLTQAEMAQRMGVTQPTVSEFEAEDSNPRLWTIARYASVLAGGPR